MAALKATRGVKLVLKRFDASVDPKVYRQICTINAERGVTFNAQVNDQAIPDCADPDLIAWLSREKVSLSVDVTGGGMNDRDDVYALDAWWRSEDALRCRLILDDDDPANVITWQGDFHLTQYTLTGERGTRVKSTLALSSDGEVIAYFDIPPDAITFDDDPITFDGEIITYGA